MARLFDDGSSEYLEIDQAVVTAVPFSFVAWFNSNDAAAYQSLVMVCDKSRTNHSHALELRGGDGGDPVRASSYDGGYDFADTSSGYSINTWHHAAGVWAATNDRAVYIDGGSKGTDSDNAAPSGIDRTSIGRFGDDSPGTYMSGRIAEAAIWNVALTDAEVLSLAKGFSPLFVHPQNLVAYWPLIRDLNDRVGGYTMVASGTTVSAHVPKIINPAPPFIPFPSAVAPGANAPTGVLYGPLVGPMGGPI